MAVSFLAVPMAWHKKTRFTRVIFKTITDFGLSGLGEVAQG